MPIVINDPRDRTPKSIKITRQCFIKGVLAEKDRVIQVDAKTANDLIAMGKAEPAKPGDDKPSPGDTVERKK